MCGITGYRSDPRARGALPAVTALARILMPTALL
jgi:hypothetical protein